jgi:hypothetical protein
MLIFIVLYRLNWLYLIEYILMKILMVTADHNDKVLAVLAFKNLNAANSIDFVSSIDELMDYIAARTNSTLDLPNLILVGLNQRERDAAYEIRANLKLTGLHVITFSTRSINASHLRMNDATANTKSESNSEELDWILKEICNGLMTKDGWQYSIKPALSLVDK